jgi:hypothetical protein
MEIFRPKQETGPETRRSANRSNEGDRRRGTWRDFRRAYPGFVFVLGLGLVTMVAVDAWLLAKRVKYNHDVVQLREHMTAAEREKSDAIVQSEQNKLRIAIELAKRQSKFDKKITLDGGTQILTSTSAQLANDSTPIPPGSLRISIEDMKAIKPNLNAGMKVYFY